MENSNGPLDAHTRSSIAYQSTTRRILLPSPASLIRAKEQIMYQERPMTLNAWTQTTAEDAEYLRAEQHHNEYYYNNNAFENSNEQKLLERIRQLEERLSQIHATSAGNQNSELMQAGQNSAPANATPIINQLQPEPKETIKYTIIAEADNGNGSGEPIEIHLAEDDGALNLNSSADSERLEIYIADDQVGIKCEENHVDEQPKHIPSPRTQLLSPITQITPKIQTAAATFAMQTTRDATPSTQTVQMCRKRKLDAVSSSVSALNCNAHGALSPIDNKLSPSNTSFGKTKLEALTPIATYSNTNATPLSELSEKNKTVPKFRKTLGQMQMKQSTIFDANMNKERVMVSIGPNNTLIPEDIYASIPWKSPSIATRRLLMTIFDRPTLATHSMTGKPSPAFKDQNKPMKKMLDRLKVEDILYAVTTKCNVSEKTVRNAITTKCADENKMMKLQMGKGQMVVGLNNKENLEANTDFKSKIDSSNFS